MQHFNDHESGKFKISIPKLAKINTEGIQTSYSSPCQLRGSWKGTQNLHLVITSVKNILYTNICLNVLKIALSCGLYFPLLSAE